MTSESTTRWPLLQERTPLATETHRVRGPRLTRSAWLLTGLAFVCGGLVSAAAFSIGWRHQAQRDTAARAALADATARINTLQRRLDSARTTAAREQAAASAAAAAERALAATGTRVAGQATASSGAAGAISSRAGSLTASASRIASELKTLDTYLSTTPTAQLDPGYVASQTAYLTQQLTRLQTDAGNLGSSVASFEASVRKLTRDAGALTSH
jgi:chromosome segregation ATPase